MKDILENYYKQIEFGYNLGSNIKFEGKIDKIFVCGMGGSAIPGEILKSYFHNSKIPIFIVKDYRIPNYLDENSLVFLISYSGNTEETLSAAQEVVEKTSKIVGICSGGKLESFCKSSKIQAIKIPSGLQPRMAYGYQFFSLLKILENSGLVGNQRDALNELIDLVKSSRQFEDQASKLQKSIKGIPLIYSTESMRAVAYKWKIDFNENCKILSFFNIIPEQNHNEINGFVNINGKYNVFIIEDTDDHERTKKRYEIIKVLIEKKKINVDIVQTKGKNLLTRIVSTIYLGDWVSYLLAIQSGIDPTPVEIIEDLKRKLG